MLQKRVMNASELHHLYVYADQLRRTRFTGRTIRYKLIECGLDAKTADQVVRDVEHGVVKSLAACDGSRDIFYGAAIALSGMMFGIGLTQNNATDITLLIALGCILGGLFQLAVGLRRYFADRSAR